MTLFLIGLLMSAQSVAPVAAAEPSTELYWQVIQQRLEIAAEEWRARIQSTADAQGDRARFAKDSAAITERFRGRRAALLAPYGITELQFLQFGSDHARELEAYLEANETLRLALADLRQLLDGLVGQFDSAAASLLVEAPQP